MRKSLLLLPLPWLLFTAAVLSCWWLTAVMAVDFNDAAAKATWQAAPFSLLFVMWSIMMAAMMLPSFIPTARIYVRMLSRQAADKTAYGFAAFSGGYLLLWLLFSAAAAGLQQLATRGGALDLGMALQHPAASATLLIAAGLFQLTPLKMACLRGCREPLFFFLLHWKSGGRGALRMGLHNGLLCLGCCWLLMLLLFVGGVMNLYWIVLLTLYVLVEKTWPLSPTLLVQGSGLLLIGAGLSRFL